MVLSCSQISILAAPLERQSSDGFSKLISVFLLFQLNMYDLSVDAVENEKCCQQLSSTFDVKKRQLKIQCVTPRLDF